jgi:flagellar protein FlgJ
MDINPNLMSVSAAQMQTRLEASQAENVMRQAQADAGKAADATKGAKSPEEKAAAMKQLVKASKDFESIFLGYLLKTMRATVPKSDLMGHSQADDIFESMRDEELSKGMAQAGGIGLAKLMVDQMKRDI